MENEEVTGEELLNTDIATNQLESEQEPSPQVLLVQWQLNKIEINPTPLEENGLLDEETKDAIKKLQQITNFTPNGMIDQNLMFRLNEIVDNQVITEYNQNKTFAVLYNNYKYNK